MSMLSRFIIAIVLVLTSIPTFIFSQDEVEKIKVKKEDTYFKAEYDEVNFKVIALDKYGNPYENAIKSFKLTFQDTQGHFENKIDGNTIPDKTIKYLKKRTRVTNMCFKEIVAQDEEGHVQSLPDKCGVLIYPDCKNCDTSKKKVKK